MTPTSSPGNPDFYCSDCSRRLGEQAFGTTAQVDVWLMLVYYGPWTAKAVSDNNLPAEVLTHLNTPLPGYKPRLQLIRREMLDLNELIAFFVAVVDPLAPRLYAFHLDSYTDLLGIDLAAIAAGDPRYEAARRAEPLLAVCTNGKRDRACAHHGLPVYRALVATGIDVWQTTHLGGHRFAGTALSLPFGVGYGYLNPEDAPALAAACRENRIDLAHLRGRSCFPAEVQAAEYFLRRETGRLDLPGFRLESAQADGPAWVVRFQALADGQRYVVRLDLDPAALEIFPNSGVPTPEAVDQYRLLACAPEASS